MIPIASSAFLIFAAYPFIGTSTAVWMLSASQLALLLGQIQKRQVSGAGAFIFMSFLFFGVRPIYMILERDYRLFSFLFKVKVDMVDVGDSMWWSTLALWCFAVGAQMAPQVNRSWLRRRKLRALAGAEASLVSPRVCAGMMFVQLLSLPIMYRLAESGRSLYGSSFGAYAYDLPVPLQSLHIVAVVVLLERYLQTKTLKSLVMLCVSVFLFLDFTWLMREVSMFRGFYIAGAMIVGIAALQRIKGRVGYAWLIIPIVALQPLFRHLGAERGLANEQLAEQQLVDEAIQDRGVAQAYWQFYDSSGDMNIFDTFVAAKKAEPAFYPYVWSWLYVPLHLIPRALWSSKPKRGITIDTSFARGAPYAPGIVGFFLLDGGLIWMLGCMTVLGFLVATLDCWVFTLPRGYLQYCLIGIVTINAMFLTRFFLWQYFYQMLYAMVPCLLLAWWFGRSAKLNAGAARNQRLSVRVARA